MLNHDTEFICSLSKGTFLSSQFFLSCCNGPFQLPYLRLITRSLISQLFLKLALLLLRLLMLLLHLMLQLGYHPEKPLVRFVSDFILMNYLVGQVLQLLVLLLVPGDLLLVENLHQLKLAHLFVCVLLYALHLLPKVQH
jgi:hypothetical protein